MNNNKGKYPKTSNEFQIKELEIYILEYWSRDRTFHKSIHGEQNFVFYDGPPFANGLPHYGHLLTGYLKDLYARYKTMCGFRVDRKFGWDCHGLPAEMYAEKALQISGRKQITEFGIGKFNNKCRSSVMKYSTEWREYIKRQGRWVDFINDYKTMDINFMESVIWTFKQLYDKGLIYESSQVLPYSWKCETTVSNFETTLDNSYRQKESKTVVVSFTLRDVPESLRNFTKVCKIVVWTTTPWTLPSNQMIAIGENISYMALIINDSAIVASKKYMEQHFKDQIHNFIDVPHQELEDKHYEPIFNYFFDCKDCFKVLIADFVTANDGTGIVHIAPGFGEDDFQLCKEQGIEIVCPVDNSGRFMLPVNDFVGMNVLDSNDKIIKALKMKGCWVSTGQHLHNYPHCWRTDTPLIYKTVDSWYLNVEQIKDRMVTLNQQVNWVPQNIKSGQFGKWLAGAKNWAISRNRFWGTPIPVWKSDNPDFPRIDVYGSIEELERDFKVNITDLHRPFIDQLERANPDDPSGKSKMKRVEEVLDCWFEAGSMPYAQFHYPFENKSWFENNFPADFITEYIAQTRGWFYTLFVLSTALFNKPPFKNCICHGVVLDIEGQKLSKRLNNYQDPLLLMDTYGADALRFLMVSSPVCTGGNLLIDIEGKMVKDISRLVLKPLWSAYHFFCMYANLDAIKAIKILPKKTSACMDRYILDKCHELLFMIAHFMDQYNSPGACNIIVKFIDILNNWYIRRNRYRFWRHEYDIDKLAAYNTLYTVLNNLCIGLAPFLPMFTEHLWLGLGNSESVHLHKLQAVQNYDIVLIEQMDLVRNVCSTGAAIRNRHNIRSRQVLSEATIYTDDESIIESLKQYSALIKDELNIKSVEIKNGLSKIAEVKVRADLSKLAARIPKMIPQVKQALNRDEYTVLPNGNIKIDNITSIELYRDEYEQYFALKDKDFAMQVGSLDIVITLDTTLTKELEIEGRARDIIRFIQQTRKDLQFAVNDFVHIDIFTQDATDINAIEYFINEIKEQTLASKIQLIEDQGCNNAQSVFGHIGLTLTKIQQ